jgi:Na+-driven multidrug efflux pump
MENWGKLRTHAIVSLLLNVIFGLILCSAFFYSARKIVSLITDDHIIADSATKYIKIVGSGIPFYALSYGFISILNAHHKTYVTMIYSIVVNMLTILLISAVFVFRGTNNINYEIFNYIAIINLSSRISGLCFLLFYIKNWAFTIIPLNLPAEINISSMIQESKVFLRFAFANTLEPISYQLVQMLLTKIIINISPCLLAMRGYILSIAGLLEVIPISISRGAQVIIGQRLGAGSYKEANLQLKKATIYSTGLTIILMFLAYICSDYIILLYTYSDSDRFDMYKQIFLITLIITFLKCISFNLSAFLKASGDIRYVATITILLSLIFSVSFSYLLFQYGSNNIVLLWYIFLFEEIIKTILFFRRWHSKKWINYLL